MPWVPGSIGTFATSWRFSPSPVSGWGLGSASAAPLRRLPVNATARRRAGQRQRNGENDRERPPPHGPGFYAVWLIATGNRPRLRSRSSPAA